MIKDYFGKIAFAGVMVAVALFSRAAYPRLYSVATGNSSAANRSASGGIPQFIFPALSLAADSRQGFAADPGAAADPASSSIPSADPGDSAMNAGAVEGGSIVAPASAQNGAILTVPTGLVAGSAFSRVSAIAPPTLAVEASLVADLATGVRFMNMNADERWPLASVTKLMTATIALDKLSPAQKITITQDAFDADPTEKTLRVGDTYSVSDLLHFLLMPSSNVAAEALAGVYGRTQFVAEMNARAKAWGMTDTHYNDPSGLAVGNQSTADDLVLLAQKVYTDYPGILAISRTPQATVAEINSGNQVVVKSINEFSGEADFIGGKTGYTDQANGNLLSIFSYESHPIVVVVLGADDGARFMNTETLYNWFMEDFKATN